MKLIVDTVARTVTAGALVIPCTIGRSGAVAAAAKREGDGCTPRGVWPLRTAFVRRDRWPAPRTALPWRWLDAADGWSDDPADPAYNHWVHHPHPFSAEHLWRDDGAYDLIVVIGYNDAPVVSGSGSAIFLHCTTPTRGPTAGCVAIDAAALYGLLPTLSARSTIAIA